MLTVGYLRLQSIEYPPTSGTGRTRLIESDETMLVTPKTTFGAYNNRTMCFPLTKIHKGYKRSEHMKLMWSSRRADFTRGGCGLFQSGRRSFEGKVVTSVVQEFSKYAQCVEKEKDVLTGYVVVRTIANNRVSRYVNSACVAG